MTVTLNNGGQTIQVELPHGTEVGHIRTLQDDLAEIGAPSSFTFAVDGRGVEDNEILRDRSVVTFRPVSASKGA